MTISMSWFVPTVGVQRSALALSTHSELAVGWTVTFSPLGSIGVQSAPVLPALLYCRSADASTRVWAVGKRRSVSRVGEYTGPAPAPATIVLLVSLFVFHCSLIVYGVAAVSATRVCTNAAFGERVPP